MSYINATRWNDIQVGGALDQKRYPELGAVNAAYASTPFVDYISPTVQQNLSEISAQRKIQIPTFLDGAVVVNQTPGYNNIPSNLLESKNFTVVAYDIFSGFRHYESTFENNQVDSQDAIDIKMKRVAYEMAKVKEQIIISVLETQKSQVINFTEQVSAATGDYLFNPATDLLTLKRAVQDETMFYTLEALAEANEITGAGRVISNRGGLVRQKVQALKYGAGNEQNLEALGFYGADRMHQSSQISAGTDMFNGFYLKDGAIGLYSNFPYEFRKGKELSDQKWTVSDVELPFLLSRCNIYTNEAATDSSALVGLKNGNLDSNTIMSTFSEMAVWDRFYVVTTPNEALATRSNDVFKIKGTVA
jgi:hypothetical protein